MDFEKESEKLIQRGDIGFAGVITLSRIESILSTAKVAELGFGKTYLILMDRNKVSQMEMNAFGRGLAAKGVKFVLGRIDADSVEVFKFDESESAPPANGESKP
jgi:hypothetical protein